MVVPPKHPKMIIFSRKTNGCWVPPFMETPILYIHLLVILFAAESVLQLLLSSIMSLGLRNNFTLETGFNLRTNIIRFQNYRINCYILLILISTEKTTTIRFFPHAQNFSKIGVFLLFEPKSCGLCLSRKCPVNEDGAKILLSKELMNFTGKIWPPGRKLACITYITHDGSMEHGIFTDPWMVDFYGKCRYIIPHINGSYGIYKKPSKTWKVYLTAIVP